MIANDLFNPHTSARYKQKNSRITPESPIYHYNLNILFYFCLHFSTWLPLFYVLYLYSTSMITSYDYFNSNYESKLNFRKSIKCYNLEFDFGFEIVFFSPLFTCIVFGKLRLIVHCNFKIKLQ